MASGIQDVLNSIEINFTLKVKYNTATGSIKIEETSEGSGNSFAVPSDYNIMDWFYNHPEYSWKNTDNTFVYPDNNNLQSTNNVLRNTDDSAYVFYHPCTAHMKAVSLIYSIFIIFIRIVQI